MKKQSKYKLFIFIIIIFVNFNYCNKTNNKPIKIKQIDKFNYLISKKAATIKCNNLNYEGLIRLFFKNRKIVHENIRQKDYQSTFLNKILPEKNYNISIIRFFEDTAIFKYNCISYLNGKHKIVEIDFLTEKYSLNIFRKYVDQYYDLTQNEAYSLCFKNGFIIIRDEKKLIFIFVVDTEGEANKNFKRICDFIIKNYERTDFLISRGGAYIPKW